MSRELRKMRLKVETATPAMLAVLESSNPTLYKKAVVQVEKFKSGSAKERSKKFKNDKWEKHIKSLSGN